jgi:hypothetical protein
MSGIGSLFNKSARSVAAPKRELKAVPKAEPKAEIKETPKQKVVKGVVKVARQVVEDLADDSSTESYYEDSDNIEKFEESEEDSDGNSVKDGEPTKRRMAGAVIKVGRRNEALKADIKELKEQLAAQTGLIAKLQKTLDDKAASKAEKKKAESEIVKVSKEAVKTAEKIEEKNE